MRKMLQYALVVAGMTSLPAIAHVGYTGRNFGTFDGILRRPLYRARELPAITAG